MKLCVKWKKKKSNRIKEMNIECLLERRTKQKSLRFQRFLCVKYFHILNERKKNN